MRPPLWVAIGRVLAFAAFAAAVVSLAAVVLTLEGCRSRGLEREPCDLVDAGRDLDIKISPVDAGDAGGALTDEARACDPLCCPIVTALCPNPPPPDAAYRDSHPPDDEALRERAAGGPEVSGVSPTGGGELPPPVGMGGGAR